MESEIRRGKGQCQLFAEIQRKSGEMSQSRPFVRRLSELRNSVKEKLCVQYVSQPWRSLPPAQVRAADWLPLSCGSLTRRLAQRSTNRKKPKIHYDRSEAANRLTWFQARDLGECFLRLPEICICPIVLQDCEHACRQVIQNMAVKCPEARVIRIEAYLDR
jgi:hypothetical protein